MRLRAIALVLLLAALAAPAAQADLLQRTFQDSPAPVNYYYTGQRIWSQADSVRTFAYLGPTQVANLATVGWTLRSAAIVNPTNPATTNSGCGSAGAATASTVTIGAALTTVTSGTAWTTGIGYLDSNSAEAVLGVVPLLQADSVVESKLKASLFDILTGLTTNEADEDHFVVATGGNAALLWGLHTGACQEFDNLSDFTQNVVDA